MPIPDLSNKPGPGRPGYPTGAYEFKLEFQGPGTFSYNGSRAAGNTSYSLDLGDGTTYSSLGSGAITHTFGAGTFVVKINSKDDSGPLDTFQITGTQANKDRVKKILNWGETPWKNLNTAFQNCQGLTKIDGGVLLGGVNCNLNNAFKNCSALTEAICKNWDLSSGCSTYSLFESCTNLELLDLTGAKFAITANSNYSFYTVGTNVSSGCNFKMANLNLTGTTNSSAGMQWFKSSKFKDGSNLSNWTFPSTLNSVRGTEMFANSIVNGTLDLSNWTWPNQIFPNFSSINSSLTSQNGSKIKLSNWDVSVVNDFSSTFVSCNVYELEGISTWGACAGNANIFRFFRSATLMRINPNDNFSDAFIASLTPSYVHEAFYNLSLSLQDSELGVCPNLNGLNLSNLISPSTYGLKTFMRSHKSINIPDFSNVTFSSTNPVNFNQAFRQFTTTGTGSNSIFNFNPVTVKPANFDNSWNSCLGLTEVNIGSNVDMSSMTSIAAMFYAINYNATATPFTNATFPTNADFSSLTTFGTWLTFAEQVLSPCQVDNFIRRLRATNNNSNVTADFYSCKVTEAPSIVRSDVDYFTNTKGWNITLATPDATLPFAYANYAVDPTGITTISPTTTPPAGSVFTATNSLSINSSTGVITIGSFRGGSTIRCTYPDGCYNEVVMLIQVPFTMRTKIPAGSTNFELKPQMSAGECFVDWGDSNSQTLTANTTHSYASSGSDQEYDIKLFDSPNGSKFTGFSTFGATEASYERTILKWGDIEWQNNSWFGTSTTGDYRIRIGAPSGVDHKPNLSQVTSLNMMFGTVSNDTNIGTGFFEDTNDNLEHWDVSTITSMENMFRNPDPISTKASGAENLLKCGSWDVSSVSNFKSFMRGYSGAVRGSWSTQTNIDMTNWDTSSATDMSYMFWLHGKNKLGIENFRTENVTNLSHFYGGGTWNAKTKMYNSILRWDVSNVEDFSSASIVVGTNEADTNANFPNNWRFSTDATKNLNFNKFCGGHYMRLGGGPYYLTDLQAFATKTINETFYGGTSYTAWNMDNASNISEFGGSSFRGNPPLGLFRNYNIADWNITSKCASFYNLWVSNRAAGGAAIPFDQNLGGWNVEGITGNQGYFMRGQEYTPLNPVNMSTSNYDATLVGWGALAASVNSGVTVDFGTSQYSPGNVYEGSQSINTYQSNKIYNGGADLRIFTSVGDVVERDPDPNGVFDTYAIITGYDAGGVRATTQGNIGPADYKVMSSDAAKGRVALILAGWTITDGGAYIPFNSVEMTINVNSGDTFSITPQSSPNNFKVDWGDGNGFVGDPNNGGANYTGSGFTATSPAYASGGNKTVKICEDSSQYIHSLSQNYNGPSAGDRSKIINIAHWGSNTWKTLYRTFFDCDNLVMNTTTTPNLANGPSLSGMFYRSAGDFTNSNIGNWNMSSITTVDGMFQETTSFNVDIGSWDIGNVTNFAGFMYNNSVFNQDISNWNTSNVTNFYLAFAGCSSLNADLNTKDTGSRLAWDVSNVTSFHGMLSGTTSMTYDIDKWQITTDPSKSVSMQAMFTGNVNWMTMEPETVTVGSGSYQRTYLAWDTQRVNNLREMFTGNNAFNKDIGKWDTSNVTNMHRTFRYATAFNNGGQPMNTRSVTVGTGATARTYNAWDVSSVTSFERGPFERNLAFNQDVSNWDVSNAPTMYRSFESAQVFDHYLPWNLNTSANPPVTLYLYNMFNGSGMSTNNYTDTLVYWANFVKNQTPDAPLNVNMNAQGGMTFDTTRSGGSNFANAGRARSFLTLDISVSGLSGFNGTYYYDYATGQYINESDSTLKFVYNTDESVWELQDEEGAQHTGSGGSQSDGPTSATWSGFTVSDASKGWTIVSDTITT